MSENEKFMEVRRGKKEEPLGKIGKSLPPRSACAGNERFTAVMAVTVYCAHNV